MKHKVLILGGDGYLGWPTAMALSKDGYDVQVVDNYARRDLSSEHDCSSLIPTPKLPERIQIWQDVSGLKIDYKIGDLTDWEFTQEVFKSYKPDTIIHYAEQPSAPYSMLGYKESQYTLFNNLTVTNNMIHAVKEFVPEAHIIKLGTMGEYGTPNIDIEEGWINITHNGREDRFLFPRQAGSIYHTTKIMDTDLLWFYVRTAKIKVTDLMQGPVYGIHTYESAGNEKLVTNFHYDQIWGTCLNRFLVQAIIGHPLTVYGKGNQTRGYLDLRDTMNCIRLSVKNPAQKGELRIFNQFTEQFSVMELAERVKMAAGKMGYKVEIEHTPNPRIEKEDHYYNAKREGLLKLGLEPHFLKEESIIKMINEILPYKSKIKSEIIRPTVKWN